METTFTYTPSSMVSRTQEKETPTYTMISKIINKVMEDFSKQLTSYIQSMMKSVCAEISEELDTVKERLNEIETKLEKVITPNQNNEHQYNEIKELEAKMEQQQIEIAELRKKALPSEWIRDMRNKQQRNEDRQRANNLIIHGIPINEINNDPFLAAADFFKNRLDLIIPVESAYRMRKGKKEEPPLFVKLQNTSDKFKIFKNCVKLKDVNNTLPALQRITVQEDLCYETRQQRRVLWPTFLKLRNEKRKVHFRGPTLFLDGKEYDGEWVQIRHEGVNGSPQ